MEGLNCLESYLPVERDLVALVVGKDGVTIKTLMGLVNVYTRSRGDPGLLEVETPPRGCAPVFRIRGSRWQRRLTKELMCLYIVTRDPSRNWPDPFVNVSPEACELLLGCPFSWPLAGGNPSPPLSANRVTSSDSVSIPVTRSTSHPVTPVESPQVTSGDVFNFDATAAALASAARPILGRRDLEPDQRSNLNDRPRSIMRSNAAATDSRWDDTEPNGNSVWPTLPTGVSYSDKIRPQPLQQQQQPAEQSAFGLSDPSFALSPHIVDPPGGSGGVFTNNSVNSNSLRNYFFADRDDLFGSSVGSTSDSMSTGKSVFGGWSSESSSPVIELPEGASASATATADGDSGSRCGSSLRPMLGAFNSVSGTETGQSW